MKVSPAAAVKIRSVLQGASNKSPRLVLRKGGCAGNMLVLLLEPPAADDEMITCEDIEFAVVKDCLAFCDDIVVDLKSDLGGEIIVRRERAQTCKCGKSFKL